MRLGGFLENGCRCAVRVLSQIIRELVVKVNDIDRRVSQLWTGAEQLARERALGDHGRANRPRGGL